MLPLRTNVLFQTALRRNPFVIWAGAAVIIACGIIWYAPMSQSLYASWDDANSTYAGMMWSRGLRPNLDFRHGYPGLASWLQHLMHLAFGPGMPVAKAMAAGFSILVAVCAYVTLARLHALLAGFAAAFFVLATAFGQWPSPNAGFVMEGLVALGLTLCVLALDKGPRWMLPLGGFLIGLSFGAKQHGLFWCLGLGLSFSCLIERDRPLGWLGGVLFWLCGPLCLAGFAALRMAQNGEAGIERMVPILPWAAALAIACRLRARRTQDDSMTDANAWALATLACCGAGSITWLALYPPDAAALARVFTEIFITVPGLIDRSLGYWPLRGWDYLAGFLVMAVAALAAFGRRWPIGFQWLLAAAILLAFWVSRKGLEHLAQDRYWLVSIMAFAGGLRLAASPRWKPARPEILLVVTGLVALVVLFPYFGNHRYALTALVTGLAVFVRAIALGGDRLTRQPATLAWLLGFLVLLAPAAWRHTLSPHNAVIRAIEHPHWGLRTLERPWPFAEAATYLDKHARTGDSISGYPNMAIVCVLLARPCHGFFPNFIGSPADFADLTASLSDRDGTDWFLISPTIYVYGGPNEYFPDPAPLFAVLDAEFDLAVEIPAGKEEVIRLYRRKALPSDAGVGQTLSP